MRALLLCVFSFLAIAAAACTRDRGAVEAPVVDLAINPIDGGSGSSSAKMSSEAPLEENASPSAGGDMIGRWEGVGTQDDGQSWDIVVNLTSLRGPCATVEYPTVPCQAKWICLSESKDGVITAQEKLVGNSTQNCIDNGMMSWRLSRDVLDWTWKGQGQTAHAQLHRTR